MIIARKYVVTKHFCGIPKREDYEVVEFELQDIQNGEILLKTECLSIDPYMRLFNINIPVPYDQFGHQIGLVIKSKDATYPIGTRVISSKGWCDYSIINPVKFCESKRIFDILYKLPDLQGLPPSLGLGAIGMIGATAYVGLLNICDPKSGETIVVTTAAGAVGSLVGQLGKIKGCKVIGFTSTDEKIKWLKDELNFDHAYNYKTTNISNALIEIAPDGIDCFFDNTGGPISSEILYHMKQRGRVAVCGCTSTYNENVDTAQYATIIQLDIIIKEIKIQGFLTPSWIEEGPLLFSNIIKWIKSGEIKAREHVFYGFDNIFDAFVGMLNGENMGKTIVKI